MSFVALNDLPDGAHYIYLNEKKPRIREKGGSHHGCALRIVRFAELPAFQLALTPDEGNRLEDTSLMVLQVHLED